MVGLKGFPFPEVFSFELNGVDKCPLCGKRMERVFQRISGSDLVEVSHWPWHTTIYHKKGGSLSFKCNGVLIRDSVVLTTGNFYFKSILIQLN